MDECTDISMSIRANILSQLQQQFSFHPLKHCSSYHRTRGSTNEHIFLFVNPKLSESYHLIQK